MPLSVGSRIAHYDVTALIGEGGGMGQVYQATDTKLNRRRPMEFKLVVALGIVLLASACAPSADPSPTERPDAVASDGKSVPRSLDYQPFTLEDARTYHRRFEQPLAAWGRGGDFTRYVFLNMSEFWRQTVLTRGGHFKDLTVDYQDAISDSKVAVDTGETTVKEYVRNSPTDGAIVVHQGRIVFEDYPRMASSDRHVWFSVSKTFVSTAVAILEDRGQIDVDEPIDAYIQELSGTAWAGIRLIDMLDMTSGIDCPEVRGDADSCFWEFYDAFGWPVTERVQDKPMDVLLSMQKLRPAGEVFDYTSVNTELLNWLVVHVSGERFADFVEREIWQEVGAEADALMTSTPNGDAFSAGGVSTTLRDLARYGMLFTPSGRRRDAPVVSDTYLSKIQEGGRAELTRDVRDRISSLVGDDSFRHKSYQWDFVSSDGDFYKSGLGGQGLYISPSRDLVVAWFGTHTEQGQGTEMLKIARQLAMSGLLGD